MQGPAAYLSGGASKDARRLNARRAVRLNEPHIVRLSFSKTKQEYIDFLIRLR